MPSTQVATGTSGTLGTTVISETRKWRFLAISNLLPHQAAVSQFWIFGLFQACHYARVVVWTPYPEIEVGKILDVRPPEIGVPVTPGMSHGTKIFVSKISSYHPQMILFYAFLQFV